MRGSRPVTRRKFLITTAAISSVAGCLGKPKNRLGVIDANDLIIENNGSETLHASNVENDGDNGVKLTTEDTIDNGTVAAIIPTTIPDVSESSVLIRADVHDMDDDAEIEIQFQTNQSASRKIFVGNQYKDRDTAVLATETGTGHSLQSDFRDLPPGDESEVVDLDQTRIEIRDGDFVGTLWALHFLFENRTVAIL